ncbi:zinc finger protein 462 [Lates calcarifer]|uniref:Zinc finger protein 462 n=1 Tax=Lates calcarifer TaxID=8187 RepID=A0AAJ7PHS0_LATCA|nr:zinc finger protein 462 [Lates calcarifer]
MQKDSVHFSTSGHTMHNQSVTQESAIKSFHCSHCTLILKSKVYLFEHLTMVHGIDIDTALRDAGLKSSETNKANTDNKSSNPGNIFLCQHCDFKACSQDVLNDHEKLCSKKLVNHNGTEILETKTIVIPTNQHKEGAVKSTSKATCALNSSKDLKTYKRPLQTITKYFAPTSGSNGKTSVKLSESPVVLDNNKATILLQESPSSSSPNSSGVFKVTAKSMIDISKDVPERFLRYDHLLISDLRPEKSREKFKETPPNNTGKRTNSEISESCAAKKAKSDKEKKELPEKANSRKQQSSRNTEFSFEFSEDEEEKMANLVNGCTESPKEYFCKHCDYSDVGIRNMSTHYQSDHPYIRYNAVYIQDQSDQSATFRCLECPIEFSSVANLKRHYTENHPEALEVFTMHLHELSLVFKCFVCPYTSKELKALKDHYKEKHPKHKVDNSLLYCRYSATRCQEGSSQLNTCEKVHSPERSDSLENANTQYEEVKNAPSTQHPTSNTADVILYQCNNCNFSHKSIVVMHVHYQKSHPGEAVTIDHIKQSAHVTSHTTSQMTPEKSETVIEDSAPQKNISESSKKAKDKAELSQQKKHTRNASLTKCNREMDSSPNKMFYCQFCSYSSTNIRSVVAHHNIKHFVHGLTDTEEILLYSATVQKKIPQNETEASARTASSDSKTSKQVEVCGEKKTQYEVDNVADASVVGSNPYACAENLFYCQKCNIGNPTVKGILNHQAKVHQRINSSRECIIEHTALVRDEIEKSKSHTKELAFSTHLPPPLMNEGDEDRLFCHFCNYRHNSMTQVMKHYLKRHNGVEVKVEQIHLHTALVLKKTQGTHLKTTANQEVSHVSLGKKGNKKKKTKKHAKCLSVSASPSATQTQRTLGCHRCTYSTQYVYLLRRHMWKIHQANRSVNDVLRVCFKQGMLQSGYHCDLCVFSHKNAEAVHMHYQEQHPTRRLSLEYVSAQLYVGPDTSSCKGKKPQIKHTGGISDGDGTDSGLLSERIAQNDIKRYSCRACSFKGSSLSSITQHYRAVHPWSVKDDGSVLNVITSKKPSANSHVEDYNQVSGSFDSYQVPLEFDKSAGLSHEATASPTMLKCLYCPARFQTHRGLSTHCGMKHPGAVPENSDEQQEQMETSVHVFKCRYCTYVNTNHKGVLTHCQMRHPASISRADSLHVDETHIQSWDNSLKRKGPWWQFGTSWVHV